MQRNFNRPIKNFPRCSNDLRIDPKRNDVANFVLYTNREIIKPCFLLPPNILSGAGCGSSKIVAAA